ncbi:KGGVGR-motif variant AAA ATPase [Streptomyces albogriseolus]|uniref:KGGVGR-motif variant AAA ATPase n=1 Tax=Streptomyces albogriseolus TaxID=1887 RepID=UPI0037FDB5A0
MTAPVDPVRFDEARRRAFDTAREVAGKGFHVVLVRDVLGRFSLVVDDREKQKEAVLKLVPGWERLLADRLGPYRTGHPVLLTSKMFSADTLLASPRAVADPEGPSGKGSVRFLDNTVVGEDWAKVSPLVDGASSTRAHRTALYGFKGGVGRTTATAVLARALADRGHVVLVVDLDLESPGAGPLLMGQHLPPHGLVDHLVEAAVDSADGLEMVIRTPYDPPRADDGRFGELWVAPARGRGAGGEASYSYADKLNRVYANTVDASFAERLEQAVCACEEAVERDSDTGRSPDVVLLDSRAGIHDVAAVTISRLCDLALLFGGNNEQTWMGYGDLFAAWHSLGQAPQIREKLRMVASMVPDSVHYPMEGYLEDFRKRSFECFEVLYDTVAPVDMGAENALEDPAVPERDDVFSPALTDDQAPHFAIPILFEPGLVGMDASNAPGWQDRAFVQAAYRDFLSGTISLIEQALSAGRDQEGHEARDE